MTENEITREIIGAAIEVHTELGPGLLESDYEKYLSKELNLRNVSYVTQKELPLFYKGEDIDCGYRLDFIIEDRLILELKACDKLQPAHEAQLLTYLKLAKIKVGLLINFNVSVLKDGIKRLML